MTMLNSKRTLCTALVFTWRARENIQGIYRRKAAMLNAKYDARVS